MDDLESRIEKKKEEIDELIALKKRLARCNEKSSELEKAFRDKTNSVFRELDRKIRKRVQEVCSSRGLSIEERNGMLLIDYEHALSFVVNLSDETRYVSRSEFGEKALGFHIEYKFPKVKRRLDSKTIMAIDERDRLEKQVEKCEMDCEYFSDSILEIHESGCVIQVRFDDSTTKDNVSVDEVIGSMFEERGEPS